MDDVGDDANDDFNWDDGNDYYDWDDDNDDFDWDDSKDDYLDFRSVRYVLQRGEVAIAVAGHFQMIQGSPGNGTIMIQFNPLHKDNFFNNGEG